MQEKKKKPVYNHQEYNNHINEESLIFTNCWKELTIS